MADKQYGVSEEMLKLFKLKQQQRNEAKTYFRKIMDNPHRSINDGAPFDPVMHRFGAMNTYKIEHFRASPRNLFYLFAILIIPVTGGAYFIRYHRMKNDRNYRDGNVAYKDRFARLIN